ncbi:MAG TPA: trypsin-like peptidase domain-containing protein, partial [Caldilineaceae bacterium]|nr:trypsin-like peptidase domain-containing protein [Caldilineaceae bacterium]
MESSSSNRGLWWLVGGVLTLLLIGCVLTSSVVVLLMSNRANSRSTSLLRPAPARAIAVEQSDATPAPLVVIATPEGGLDYESAVLMNIYEQVNPSVVNVTNLATGSSIQGLQGNFHGDELLPQGTGSGFVWDDAGHIVTNDHVVQGADELQVTFSDGTASVAEVVGVDPDSDLAVIKIQPEGYTLVPVRRGSLNDVRVGMRVAAIGNPFGLEGTLTSGIVSALGRSIPALASFSIPNSIQTEAPINPGNSG